MAIPNNALTSGAALAFIPATGGGGGLPADSFTVVNVGTFTANGTAAVTVADTGVSATSIIIYTLGTVGGTPAGKPYEATITPGTGWTVKAAAGDTSTYNFLRIG
jgi:hypothetical protein